MFLYERIDDHVKILGSRAYDGQVVIPEKIEGKPVTELAAYAFSDGYGRSRMLSSAESLICCCDLEGNPVKALYGDAPPEVTGERLVSLKLPETIEKIGNYAFYNCRGLRKLECHTGISDLGSGLFTGCSGLKELKLYVEEEKRSCMKEILSEIHQQLLVEYVCGKGRARLLFPEMFEEAVENTPARIISREMHGCGHRYRYCFDQTKFVFHKYDGLFAHMVVQEPEAVVTDLALGRLYYPLGLLKAYKEVYEAYITDHIEAAAREILEEKDEEQFIWLARCFTKDREGYDKLIELAARGKEAGLLSRLMDMRRKRFPPEKRSFVL